MSLNNSHVNLLDAVSELTERTNPKDYARLVAAFAQHTIGTSPIAGELFEGLAAFLSREPDRTKLPKVDVVVNTLSTSLSGESQANVARHTAISELDQLQHVLSATRNPAVAEATMIFMRGHQPPECLTRIGATCHISPFFFLRHLEYFWSYRPLNLFSSPCLPSGSCRILRLKLVTLGERAEKSGWGGSPQVQDLRAKSETGMTNYLHDVSREYKLNPGSSIVRTFNVHSSQYFSIEQEVTVTVQAKETGWLVLAWTDAGQHLGNGPEGPWRPERSRNIPRNSVFIPTTQHFTDKTMKVFSTFKNSRGYHPDHSFAQSALSLAPNYGLTLDHALAGADSFYALTELFQTSATSICQLLNLVETIIDKNTGYNQYKSQDFGLGNLSYHQDILKRLELRLRENISDLEGYHSPQWPRSYNLNDDGTNQSRAKATAAAESLLTDFRNLLSRTVHLSAQCQSGTSVRMNSAAIAESQRAIDQAKQVGRLTRLAFFYIPLSFTTSFLGMNLKIFGSGTLQLWVWFAFSVPLLLVSYFVLAWLSGDIGRRLLYRKVHT